MCNHHILVSCVRRWCDELLLFSLSLNNKIFLLFFGCCAICKWPGAFFSLSLVPPAFLLCSLLWHIPSTDWKSSPTHLHDFTWTPNYECNQPVTTGSSCWLPEYYIMNNTLHYTHICKIWLLKKKQIHFQYFSLHCLFVCFFTPRFWSGVKMCRRYESCIIFELNLFEILLKSRDVSAWALSRVKKDRNRCVHLYDRSAACSECYIKFLPRRRSIVFLRSFWFGTGWRRLYYYYALRGIRMEKKQNQNIYTHF